jgi:protein required for attachment to host cells
MKIANGALILVTDGAKMLLFRNAGDEKFAVLETVTHATHDDRPSREIGTDAPGRTHSSTSAHRSSYSETDWHQQSEDDFVRGAAVALEQAVTAGQPAGVVVIAAPRALGVLRQHYGRATSAQLLAEIAKDLASHTTDDVIAALDEHDAT